MRVPHSGLLASGRADAALTPMIDVIFQLLIFFVWTAGFQAVEFLLPSTLQTGQEAGLATSLDQADFERIVVRLQAQAGVTRWTLNGQPTASLTELGQRLITLAAIRADLPVVIDPELTIPLSDVIDVYDTARQAGLVNLQFTTRGDE